MLRTKLNLAKMKNLRILSLAVLAVTFVLGSCSKYEEGPALSLRTKKARVANTWKADKYVSQDGTETQANDESTSEYTKDGNVTITSGSFSFNGTWEFNSDKTGIITTFEQGGVSSSSTSIIIKLKNDEMWITDEEDYNESADNYGGYTVLVSAN